MTDDKDSAVLAELLETMRERCADPCRSEKAELGCDCDAARRAAVMLRQPTQSDALREAVIEECAKALEDDAKQCDCFARNEGECECGCGAWCEWKSMTSARAVEIVRSLVKGTPFS